MRKKPEKKEGTTGNATRDPPVATRGGKVKATRWIRERTAQEETPAEVLATLRDGGSSAKPPVRPVVRENAADKKGETTQKKRLYCSLQRGEGIDNWRRPHGQ